MREGHRVAGRDEARRGDEDGARAGLRVVADDVAAALRLGGALDRAVGGAVLDPAGGAEALGVEVGGVEDELQVGRGGGGDLGVHGTRHEEERRAQNGGNREQGTGNGGHELVASFSKRGLPLRGLNMGSMRSQAGVM